MRQVMKSTLLICSMFLLNISLFAQDSISDLKEFLEDLQKNQQEMSILSRKRNAEFGAFRGSRVRE